MRPITFTPAGLAASLLVFVVAGACVRLGFWQLDRLDQRRERNRAVAERLEAPPLEGVVLGGDSAGLLHRRVRLRGRPDTANALIWSGRVYRGAPGVHVVVPVWLSGGRTVLVDRGWAPSADAHTLDVQAVTWPDTLAVEGVVLPLSRNGVGSDDARVVRSLSQAALSRALPYDVPPFVVQAAAVRGGSRGSPPQPPPDLSDGPHLGYALQWFAFAAVALIGWLAMVLRRRTGVDA